MTAQKSQLSICILAVVVSAMLASCQNMVKSDGSGNSHTLPYQTMGTLVDNDAAAIEDYYLESNFGIYGSNLNKTYIPGVADMGGSRICIGNNRILFASLNKVYWLVSRLGGNCEAIWNTGSSHEIFALAADSANNAYFIDRKAAGIFKINPADGTISSVISSLSTYLDIDCNNNKIYLLASQSVDIYDSTSFVKILTLSLSDTNPRRMVVDNNLNIYVLYDQKVKVYLYSNGQYGTGEEIDFISTVAGSQGKEIAVDNQGYVYILQQIPQSSSRYKATISKYRVSDKRLQAKFNVQQSGLPETVHMAVDSDENVFVVTKTENSDVSLCLDIMQVYSKSTTLNKFWALLGQESTSLSAGIGEYHALAVASNADVVLAYSDDGKTKVKRYSGSSWTDLSTVSTECGDFNSVGVDSKGDIYVAFSESGMNDRIRVRKYHSAWSDAGSDNGCISSGAGGSNAMAIASDDTVYMAFQEENINGINVRVRAFNATTNSWTDVGGGIVSTGTGSDVALAVAQNGDLVVAFKDSGYGNKTRVRQYTNTAWTDVGADNGCISAGTAVNNAIAIASNGDIVVAYLDQANGSVVRVKKYTNSAWSDIGGNVSTGSASNIALSIGPNGDIYTIFSDAGLSSKTRVRKFSVSANAWSDAGANNGCISVGNGSFNALAIAANGDLYAAYKDAKVFNKTRLQIYSSQKLF